MTVSRDTLNARYGAQQKTLSELFLAGRMTEAQYWDQAEQLHNEQQAALAKLDTPPAEPKRPAKSQLPPPAATPFYAQASEALYADPRLSDSARRLVLLLVRLARGRGSCDAFIDQLADMLSLSGRTIQRAQIVAMKAGYIRVEHVREGRINDANVYHLLAPCAPQGRPEPRQRRSSEARRPRRRRAMGVTKTSPHEERFSNENLPPCSPPSGDLKGGPLVAAQLIGPAPWQEPERLTGRCSAGDRGANSVPATGPP